MTVNIIIPLYNTTEENFNRAMISITAQRARKYVVTVVDDASDEEFQEGYQRVIEKFHQNVNFIRLKENVGPGLARQVGINEGIPTDYIMFLDSDDILAPNAVKTLYSEAKVNNSDLVVGSIHAEGNHRSKDKILGAGKNSTWMGGKIYKREYLERINLRFSLQIKYNEDAYFNICALNGTDNKHYVDEVCYIWIHNPNSLTRTSGQKLFRINHNLDYFKAVLYGTEFLLHLGRPAISYMGTIGSLYNAYQYEVIHKPENTDFMNKEIYSFLHGVKGLVENIESKAGLEAIMRVAKVGQDGEPYQQSLSEWLKLLFWWEKPIEKQRCVIFSGKAGHGKDTAANMLRDELEKDGYKVARLAYADYLKYLCKEYFGWDGQKGEEGREILQQVGTNTVRVIDPNLWVDNVIRLSRSLFKDYDFIIISDGRFPNEVDRWEEHIKTAKQPMSLTCVRVERPGFDNGLTEIQKNHPSETSMDNFEFNNTVSATTLEELKNEIIKLKLDFYE